MPTYRSEGPEEHHNLECRMHEPRSTPFAACAAIVVAIGLATVGVESNYTVYANPKVAGSLDLPHDAVGSDGMSVGPFQQQVRDSGGGWWWGPVDVCQDPTGSARLFF